MERSDDTALCVLRVNRRSYALLLGVLMVNRWTDVITRLFV
jgi:hypothetical protein